MEHADASSRLLPECLGNGQFFINERGRRELAGSGIEYALGTFPRDSSNENPATRRVSTRWKGGTKQRE
jgi:hypothetical protein